MNGRDGLLWKNYKLNSSSLRLILIGSLFTASSYVLGPSIISWLFPRRKAANKRSKRLDQYTTGLFNSGNYCFANSSVQALASLPPLTVYLNGIFKAMEDIYILLKEESDDQETVQLGETEDQGDDLCWELRSLHGIDFRMHIALGKVLHNLQQPIKSPRNASLYELLSTIEEIHHCRISSYQQDAQEFSQLLIETLENEFNRFKKFLSENVNRTDAVSLPLFPFNGFMANSIVCMKCNRSARVKLQPFNMYLQQIPQTTSVLLETLIHDSQAEIIEDYSCLVCKLNEIFANERQHGLDNKNDSDKSLLQELDRVFPTLAINDYLPDPLATFVSSYSMNRVSFTHTKSRIVKKTVLVNSPEVLIIHLSRSVFNGYSHSKNNCKVNFEEYLNVKEQIIESSKCVGVLSVRYKLMSVTVHSGTHTRGHYQCYRRKPNFERDCKTPSKFMSSAAVFLPSLPKNHSSHSNADIDSIESNTNHNNVMDNGRETSFEKEAKRSMNNQTLSDPPKLSPIPHAFHNHTTYPSTKCSSYSSNVTNNVSSQPLTSIELASSALSDSLSDSHQRLSSTDILAASPPNNKRSGKTLKIASTLPWWKISDTKVSEHKLTTLLFETKNVYMLYYQRIQA
ncbi:HDR061Cp [Eremothecium sinecaudum]|uniref:Ubiquitin carboxyl-terminal hydrolase n=1 Tax=Eremothecium sinecaudum TaxID=45286 RepID=A0A109UZB1_9SACH|nr:HDR061Cp [Eremothecium sinecaudum]AMD20803.1 HDR061Cp [Eremothecium sinecaudum]